VGGRTPKRKETGEPGGKKKEGGERKKEKGREEKAVSYTGNFYTYITNWENDRSLRYT
jgi:hypothetical protein